MKYKKVIIKQLNEGFRDISTFGSLPFTLLMIIILFFINLSSALIILIGLILIHLTGSLIKLTFYKKRPNKQTYSNFIEKIDAGSFPSIHSARILLIALAIYSLFSSITTGIIITLVLLVGMSRIYLKKHYLIDVIGGYILGFICWYLTGIIIKIIF